MGICRRAGDVGSGVGSSFKLGFSPDFLLVRGTSANLVRALVYQLGRSFLGSTIVLGGGGGSVASIHSYILGISLGGRQDMYMERLVDSVVVRARDVMTSS